MQKSRGGRKRRYGDKDGMCSCRVHPIERLTLERETSNIEGNDCIYVRAFDTVDERNWRLCIRNKEVGVSWPAF